jgi:GT2 family glycosyltransferase
MLLKLDGTYKQAKSCLVIIPSYGHFNYVARTAHSISHHASSSRFQTEFVVIDDGSSEWATVDWTIFPDPNCRKLHFVERAGLTRSWNAGLRIAKENGFEYTVCGNSDLLFSSQWLAPMIRAIDRGFSLVGPLTNAPGHCPWQNVRPFLHRQDGEVQIDDSADSLDKISHYLRSVAVGPIQCPLNGFCLMARTDEWWKGAFDKHSVFDSSFPLDGNEVELQHRWANAGMISAMVPESYVFHYRSVSRPEGLMGPSARGAFRPPSSSNLP